MKLFNNNKIRSKDFSHKTYLGVLLMSLVLLSFLFYGFSAVAIYAHTYQLKFINTRISALERNKDLLVAQLAQGIASHASNFKMPNSISYLDYPQQARVDQSLAAYH